MRLNGSGVSFIASARCCRGQAGQLSISGLPVSPFQMSLFCGRSPESAIQAAKHSGSGALYSASENLSMASFLPPSFELVPRLLLLLDDPEVSGDDLADVIRVDPGLT